MPRRDCSYLLQICLQNVPDKSNSISIEPLQEYAIYPIYVLNPCRQYQEISDLLFSSELNLRYRSICIVLYVCDI